MKKVQKNNKKNKNRERETKKQQYSTIVFMSIRKWKIQSNLQPKK